MRLVTLLVGLALLLTALSPLATARSPHRVDVDVEVDDGEGTAALHVVLNTTGGDGTFLVEVDGDDMPDSFTLTTTNGTANATFSGLDADEDLALAAKVPAGWRLVSAACSAGTLGDVDLGDNATTTCWIDMQALATLHVKVTAPGNGTFSFAGAGASLPATFTVGVANGSGARVLSNLLPATNFTVTALAAPGWTLDDASCEGNVSIAPGANATCTFAFTRAPGLVVEVRALGGDGTFAFTGEGDGVPARFDVTTVNGSGSVRFASEAGEEVSARLTTPAGWELRSGACVDRTVPATGEATCTFTLAKLAAIRVSVKAIGGDDEFTLRVTDEDGDVDTYRLETDDGWAWKNFTGLDPDDGWELQLRAPAGWRVSASPCGDVDPKPGEAVACAFVVTRLGEASGTVKRSDTGAPVEGITVYADLDGDGEKDAREPDDETDDDGDYTLEGIPPGDATLRLVLPSGWRVVSPASGGHALDVDAGEVFADKDFRVVDATPPADEDQEKPAPRGGGLGYWKNWANHFTQAEVDRLVADAARGSGTLMPAGYPANATGLVSLIRDAQHGCRRADACHLRAAADELVGLLNEAVGHPGLRGKASVAAEADAEHGDAKATADAKAEEPRAKGKAEWRSVRSLKVSEILGILERVHGGRLTAEEMQAIREMLKA